MREQSLFLVLVAPAPFTTIVDYGLKIEGWVKSVRELAFQLSQKLATPPILETSSARRRLFLPLQQNTFFRRSIQDG